MNRECHEQLVRWFQSHCASFYTDVTDDQKNILLKEEHTHRVRDNMDILAESLGLTENDRLLAATVALFHDVGRFEQYLKYRTFKDSASENHAAIGARILAEHGVLREFSPDELTTVIRAVALHNVYHIPDGLTERDLLFLRLIRDADKLDIWRVFIEYYALPHDERASAVGLGFADMPECSPEVVEALAQREMVNLSLVRTLDDFKLLQLSWVYDLNFPVSLRLFRERGYLESFESLLPQTPEVARALKSLRDFIQEKIEIVNP
ncbi:MAG: HD domain-containing protein [Geobacter sp.]|nr:HD domain-containing protein [Geobacter sp.]